MLDEIGITKQIKQTIIQSNDSFTCCGSHDLFRLQHKIDLEGVLLI